ncbi:MAG: LuxR C-terminal-related transcriptional regulator [Solirubrobacteraceae bacterium]
MQHTLFLIIGVSAYAELLRAHIQGQGEFVVVRIAGDGRSGLQAIDVLDRLPDIVLLDVGAPLSLEAAQALRARHDRIRVVLIGVDETPAEALAWAAAGAAGLVGRTAPLAQLLDTLRAVARGEAPCSPGVVTALLRGVASLGDGAYSPERGRLTAREHEVAEMLADGLTNMEMAQRMQIELGTVKTHVHSVIRKLGVTRRVQVAGRMHQRSIGPTWHRDTLGV